MADALAVAKIRELAASLSQVLDEDPDQADCPATTSLMGDDDVMDEELKSRLLTRIVDLESKTKGMAVCLFAIERRSIEKGTKNLWGAALQSNRGYTSAFPALARMSESSTYMVYVPTIQIFKRIPLEFRRKMQDSTQAMRF